MVWQNWLPNTDQLSLQLPHVFVLGMATKVCVAWTCLMGGGGCSWMFGVEEIKFSFQDIFN